MSIKTNLEFFFLATGVLSAVTLSYCQQDPEQEPGAAPPVAEKSDSSDGPGSERIRPNRELRKERARRERAEGDDVHEGVRTPINKEPLSSQQQDDVEAFVRENIPELGKVLRALREKRPQQYQRAIGSIEQSYVRLQKIKADGNEQAYNSALENWKTDARIKMISAQLTVKKNPVLQTRLETLVTRQAEQRLSQMKSERERLQKRLGRLESSIADFETRMDGEIKRRIAAINRSTEQAREEIQEKASTRPAGDKPGSVSEIELSQPEKEKQKDN